ncbi:MAG TPA: hypothetical protein VIF62_29620 [Labilithrix sp.]|jgi:hypothetical protein
MRLALPLFCLLLVACDLNNSDAADGGTSCGSQTCTSAQVCAYRECTMAERCVVATQCPTDSTPTTCSGQNGCLLASCGPVVVGCRAVPSSCTAGDGMCACGAICGDAGGCAKVDGLNVDCVGAP